MPRGFETPPRRAFDGTSLARRLEVRLCEAESRLRLEEAVAMPVFGEISRSASVPNWFALVVRPRHDKAVANGLQTKGFDTVVPTYKKSRRYATRTKEWDLPLFPGYVFCRFDACLRMPILTMPGVVGIVGAGSTPIPVDET